MAQTDLTERQAQAPIMVAQVTAIRRVLAVQSETIDPNASAAAIIGEVLATNMLAGFALELALKVFYRTFDPNPSGPTHGLHALYCGLPEGWRNEIDSAYRGDPRSTEDVALFAMRTSPTPPATPGQRAIHNPNNADRLFRLVDQTFVHSRYYFERVNADAWEHVTLPLGQMLAMIDVLQAFYQHCLTETRAEARRGLRPQPEVF